MTTRKFTIERQPTDLLLARLRQYPSDRIVHQELTRRGEGHRANQIVAGELEDRALQGMDHQALGARAHAMDQEIVAIGQGAGLPLHRAGGIA
jgi:hypothetical protein